MRLRLNRVNEHSDVQLHRLAPELVKVDFAQIGAFDVRCDHGPHGSPLRDRPLQFRSGFLRIGEGHRCKHREALWLQLASLRQVIVKVLVPCDRPLPWHSMGKYVCPYGQDLAIDALLGHCRDASVYRLDELREERPDLQPVVEMQRTRAGRRMIDHRYAEVRGARCKAIQQARRHIVGVNIYRHHRTPSSKHTIGAASVGTCPIKHTPRRQSITRPPPRRIALRPSTTARTTMPRATSTRPTPKSAREHSEQAHTKSAPLF